MCCNYKDQDPHAQDFKDKSIMKLGKYEDLMKLAAKNKKNIIKIQAIARGFLVRKKNRDFTDAKPQSSKRSKKMQGGRNMVGNKGKLLGGN